MNGGYINDGRLSQEHLKLPSALQRRVGAKIKVLFVGQKEVRYRNELSGRVHVFRLKQKNGTQCWCWASSS